MEREGHSQSPSDVSSGYSPTAAERWSGADWGDAQKWDLQNGTLFSRSRPGR